MKIFSEIKYMSTEDTHLNKVLLLTYRKELDYLDAKKTYSNWVHRKMILTKYDCDVLELKYDNTVSKRADVHLVIYIRPFTFSEYRRKFKKMGKDDLCTFDWSYLVPE
jgi:hypothetical protein